MKFYTLIFVLAAVVFVECGHTFLGSNVLRPLAFHKMVKYPAHVFQKTIEHLNFTIPNDVYGHVKSIQGILAYDMKQSGASVNVTHGGLGHNFVTLRLKSDRASEMHYDIYIYA